MRLHTRLSNMLRVAELAFREDAAVEAEGTLAGKDGIVLIHGLCGTPRTLRPLRRSLQRSFERPMLEIRLGLGLGDIRDMATRVDDLLVEREIRRCDVVAYSMGGLVAAHLLKCLDQGRRIRRVVTLGTPHQGIALASEGWLRATGLFRSLAQMRVGSNFLRQLRRIPMPRGTQIVSIAGAADLIVPVESARVAEHGCRNLVIPGIDHWGLLLSRRVFRCAGRALQRDHLEPHLDPSEFPGLAAAPLRLAG